MNLDPCMAIPARQKSIISLTSVECTCWKFFLNQSATAYWPLYSESRGVMLVEYNSIAGGAGWGYLHIPISDLDARLLGHTWRYVILKMFLSLSDYIYIWFRS